MHAVGLLDFKKVLRHLCTSLTLESGCGKHETLPVLIVQMRMVKCYSPIPRCLRVKNSHQKSFLIVWHVPQDYYF